MARARAVRVRGSWDAGQRSVAGAGMAEARPGAGERGCRAGGGGLRRGTAGWSGRNEGEAQSSLPSRQKVAPWWSPPSAGSSNGVGCGITCCGCPARRDVAAPVALKMAGLAYAAGPVRKNFARGGTCELLVCDKRMVTPEKIKKILVTGKSDRSLPTHALKTQVSGCLHRAVKMTTSQAYELLQNRGFLRGLRGISD